MARKKKELSFKKIKQAVKESFMELDIDEVAGMLLDRMSEEEIRDEYETLTGESVDLEETPDEDLNGWDDNGEQE